VIHTLQKAGHMMEAIKLIESDINLSDDVDELASLKKEQSCIANRIKEVSDRIIDSLKSYGDTSAYNYDRTVSVKVVSRDNWQYSDGLALRYEKLKLDRKKEQLSGKARRSVTHYLRIKD